MDQLFKRYADPFSFMDQMIECGRFSEFVSEIVKIINEEQENDAVWQYYLHHPMIEISFAEFKRRIGFDNTDPEENECNLETTVRKSKNILDGFVPDDIEEN